MTISSSLSNTTTTTMSPMTIMDSLARERERAAREGRAFPAFLDEGGSESRE
jgi:hypothetical protein